MAHFAEIDDNNVVLRVVVVSDRDTSDPNGVEKEHIGAAFCEKLFGGRWLKTSYNSNIRKNFAGIGMVYNEEHDVFILPKPYPSWILNTTSFEWEAPVPVNKPDGVTGIPVWNEQNLSWDFVD